ncbi:glycosyltransferase family 2 protein [Scatolibacter rhodanostii]|uniref:glycosyltransferase family 2 protein n=1 Tax=Scatolibacter rhodanostii TaxID=2014781 RepID=UPI000C080B5F|nr:glycosyltransferase [Scatolibacter rhodanostii]
MRTDYHFAADENAQQIIECFARMLDTAEQMAAQWPNQANGFVEILAEELLWIEESGGNLSALKESFFAEQIKNIRFTLDKIKESFEQSEVPNWVRWQLPCFLQELREELYFWAYVHPFPERWNYYYKNEFAEHHQNTAVDFQKSKYEVSIFVPAKDKLEYTKRCVESIRRETKQAEIAYELILINHGSQDNTQDYFESIPEAKILCFKQNVRMMAFTSAMRVCEGRYMAFVSNDTVVTKDWLTLLYRCLQANPNFISATPTTPNVSNFQSTAESYANLEEMAQFAAKHNQDDPTQWEQRSRILPVIALYDLEKLNAIGFGDRYFRTMEFWDDDLSLRARRAGYRQVLCRNVFCHHYGSVTGREAQIKENTLQKGRELFIAKHQADPWNNGAYYDYQLCTRLQAMDLPATKQADILGIDAGFGDTLLQIGNILRKKEIETNIDSITSELQYTRDLRMLSQSFCSAKSEENILGLLTEAFQDKKYDYIYLGRPLEDYNNWKKLLTELCNKIKPGGMILFYLSNALNLVNIQSFVSLAFPFGKERLNYLNPEHVRLYLQQNSMIATLERKRGWASAALLGQLAKHVQSPLYVGEAMSQALDTIGFYYYAHMKE